MLDLVLENCKIFGRDGSWSLGIKRGRIALVEEDIKEHAKSKKDMQGKLVTPGFVDSHTHLLSLGLEKTRVSLFSCKSLDEAVDRIRRESEGNRKIIIAYKWDESLWGSHEYLERKDIDFTEKPVIAYRRDGHMATLNSAALRLVGKEASRDGILKEEELRLLDPLVDPDPVERKNALIEAQKDALSNGVTAVRDMVDRATYDAYSRLENRIRIFRTVYDREMFQGIGVNNGNDWGIKTFLDGSIGARTAAHEGWARKNLLMDDDQFDSLCRDIWSRNLPVAVHAIGEYAVETAVRVLSRHSGRFRNSIEHFELMPDGVIESMNHSIVVSSQPNFLEWAGYGGMYEDRLGREWLNRNNTFRELIDANIPLAFGSDSMPLGPLYGIHYAVNSQFTNQRITIEEAIKCYTEGGAYLLGMENIMGKIEEGYLADFAVFENDLSKETGSIKNIKPVATVVDGRFVFGS
ncbi:MAG: amidohydrolase [Candidatus Micrarchaeaceae archaeon]